MQQSGTSKSSSFLPFGCVPPPTNGSSLFGPLPSVPTGVSRFSLPPSRSNLSGQSMSTTGFVFPGFGVDYLPGSNSNPFGQNPCTTGGGSIFDGPKTSSPQPFGFNAATNPLPSSSLSSPATFSSNPNTGFNPFNVWSHRTEQGSSYPRYAPTPDEVTGGMYNSISASKAYQHKSHEELRWEDYKQGNKGSRTNTVFGSPQMASPWVFASPSLPVHPQRTTFGSTQEGFTSPVSCFDQHNPAFKGFISTTQESFTSPVSCFAQHNPAFKGFGTLFPNSSSSFFPTFPPISSSVQRPHETTAVSSPASGCTACGSTTSTSASGCWIFNGATSAHTTFLPGLFYPPYGYVPMMCGTTPAAQVTTPAPQAYPFNGYILLPFAAMNLQ